jgi:hypothetical protein
MSQRGFNKAWLYTYLLFIGGAGCACFGDKHYGRFPQVSLRWLFVIIGVILMAVSAVWMHTLQQR